MKVIQANCRSRFTAEDVAFVARVLGRKAGQGDCLIRLLSDPDTRDMILDDEALFHALLEQPECVPVSTHFYFYILARQVLRRAGIEDRSVADYVAALLTEYSRVERTRCVAPGAGQPMEYVFEMLAALRTVDDRAAFMIRAHVGNHSLFLTGIYPEHVQARTQRRGAPGLNYFEELGRASYRVASGHLLAQRYELSPIFDTLAERFHTARGALNDLSGRLLSWHENPLAAEILRAQSGEN